MDCTKHIATGGWWKDSKTHQWVHAAPKLLYYILDHTEHAKLIGLPVKQPHKPGTSRNSPQTSLCAKKAPTRLHNSLTTTTRRTEASNSHLGSVTCRKTDVPSHCTTTYHYIHHARTVVACSGDVVNTGDFALARMEGVSLFPFDTRHVLMVQI